jgi:serine/threonine-protein kinase
MFTAEGQVVLTDFGIARISDFSKTRTGIVVGTPSYMSPEQLCGTKVESRSDLFSLGVTLYQLACGRLPFEGDSMAQRMFRIANETHPDIRIHDPSLPACIANITNRALAKDPRQRYQNGEQMAKAIKACFASLAAAERPATEGFANKDCA